MFRQDSLNRTMQGCNDCAFDYDGNLWVTAPAGEIAPAEYKRSFEVISLTYSHKELLINSY
jgi:hypothetical protein